MALTIPTLQELSEDEIMAWDPEIRPVIHRQPLEQKERASLPPYIVAPLESLPLLIREKFPNYKRDELCVKIIDFGNGGAVPPIHAPLKPLTVASGL